MTTCRQSTMTVAVALLVLAAWPASAQTPPGGAAKPQSAAAGLPAAAQTSPEPAKAPPAVVKLAGMPDIEFYLARGEADACGRGCNKWIAAEGKIDLGAAQRLRRLLVKLGQRRLPIFFHSPGGVVPGSIELGRLIRDQKLEVSVAHTIPLGCDRDKPLDKSCEALKRSGQELEAEFDPAISMCNSACVLAFAGGTTRFVPPWVKLGIHDVGFDPEKPPPRGASLTEAKRVIHERMLNYLRDMGIDTALLTAASAVPNESVRFLERGELVRFGIDRREFGETGWRLVEKPTVAVVKTYFARTGNEQLAYRNALVRLSCGARKTMSLAIAREVAPSETIGFVARPMQIALGGRRIDLPSRTAAAGGFDIRLTNLSVDFVESINDGGAIEIFAVDADRKSERLPAATLSLDGFSDASVKLRKSCDESARNAIAVALPTKPVAGPFDPYNPFNPGNLGAKSPSASAVNGAVGVPHIGSDPISPTQGPPRAQQTANSAQDWTNQLVEILEHNKRYPEEARLRGEQGLTKIGFSLSRDGKLISTWVKESSGSLTLDQEAVDMVRRAEPFPPPPPTYSDARLTFIIPVRFRLPTVPGPTSAELNITPAQSTTHDPAPADGDVDRLPAARDCPTAQSGKVGVVVEKGEQQQDQVVDGNDGIVPTLPQRRVTC